MKKGGHDEKPMSSGYTKNKRKIVCFILSCVNQPTVFERQKILMKLFMDCSDTLTPSTKMAEALQTCFSPLPFHL